MKVKENLTVPNLLTVLRILLIPFVLITYLRGEYVPAIGLLILSGLTDVADGFIARHFNQISDLGKILDPIADKLTQFSVLVCLSIHHPRLVPVAVILAVKEVLTLIGAMIFVRRGNPTPYARWWGKMTTVVLFLTMGLVVLRDWVPAIPDTVIMVAVSLTIACMAFSFYNYLLIYLAGCRKPDADPDPSADPGAEEESTESSEK